MDDQLRFDGKVVVVTGAGNGLGRAYAELFASRGALVVVNDLGGNMHGGGCDTSVAERVVGAICKAGGQAVANTDSVEEGDKIIQCALDNFARVDVVVNNAGITRFNSFHKMTEDEWEAVYRVHVLGAYRVTRAAWPYMREQRYGRVIMTSSAAGLYGALGAANYSMAKLGLHGLAQSLSIEGQSRNIHVNTIAPVAGTRLIASLSPETGTSLVPLSPAAISPLVIYLCHETCKVTGELFELGGGWVSRVCWQRSRGVNFDATQGHSVEDIAKHWTDIIDMTNAVTPSGFQDSFDCIGKNAGLNLAVPKKTAN